MPDYYNTAKQRPHPNSRVAWPLGNRELSGWYDGWYFCVVLDGRKHICVHPPARWRYLKMDER